MNPQTKLLESAIGHVKFIIKMTNNSKISARHVVFDLDGTLVDSAPSILASMLAALNEEGIKPIRPLTPEIIGPPLPVLMASLLPEASLEKLPRLTETFKRHYDELGYRETRIYEGIPEMLTGLRELGFSLYIATNKRVMPTHKIVNYIGWTNLFDGFYSLDYFVPALHNKIEMLRRLNHELQKTSARKIYIGDRAEDGIAAINNNFCFFGASWGYGASELKASNFNCILSPKHIIEILGNPLLLEG